MKRSLILSVLFTGSWFAAEAQQSAQGEPRQRPDPAQMAAKMMGGFDANKDSILSQAELALALDDMHKNRPPRPAQNDQPADTNQVVKTEQRPEPPSSDSAAAQMIEKFSSSKKGLTQDELVKALGERRGRQGGQSGQGGSREDHPPRN
ncbi:MAG: hypothetical protein WCG03_04800 [Kiritimatiellales bacterium]